MRNWLKIATVCALALAWIPTAAQAEEEEQSPTVVRTSDGLKFAVPPDWPIEKRNGVVGPIPIEEYLGRKFGALDKKVQALEQKVGALESKVSALELKAKAKPLQSQEGAAP